MFVGKDVIPSAASVRMGKIDYIIYRLNKAFIYIILIFSSPLAIGQTNLVYNGSFEDTIKCPLGADIFNAAYWQNPSDGTPDYFNICANSINYGVPINCWGDETAHSGLAYGSILTYGQGTDYREYILGKLNVVLEKNSLYRVSFYVSLADLSVYATNNIGVAFLNNSTFYSTALTIPVIPSFNYSECINVDTGWKRVEFAYLANGTENHFIIGNFYNDMSTSICLLNQNAPFPDQSLYYVDDVSVEKIEFNFPNIFTPNEDGINDVITYNLYNCEIDFHVYNRWGQLVYKDKSSNIMWDGKNENGTMLVDGVYFYVFFVPQFNIEHKGFVQLVR